MGPVSPNLFGGGLGIVSIESLPLDNRYKDMARSTPCFQEATPDSRCGDVTRIDRHGTLCLSLFVGGIVRSVLTCAADLNAVLDVRGNRNLVGFVCPSDGIALRPCLTVGIGEVRA